MITIVTAEQPLNKTIFPDCSVESHAKFNYAELSQVDVQSAEDFAVLLNSLKQNQCIIAGLSSKDVIASHNRRKRENFCSVNNV